MSQKITHITCMSECVGQPRVPAARLVRGLLEGRPAGIAGHDA
jgi:hypothetical protein